METRPTPATFPPFSRMIVEPAEPAGVEAPELEEHTARDDAGALPMTSRPRELLELEPCRYCGGDAIAGSTCPRSIECPRCGAAAGASCRRPSGHRADVLHAARVRTAEKMDEAPARELEPAAARPARAHERRPAAMSTDHTTADELYTLAAEIVSLAQNARNRDRRQEPANDAAAPFSSFFTHAADFAQRANALGYPSIADGIDRAKKCLTWHNRADALRDVARHARRLAAELRQTADDDQRAAEEGDEQRDYAEERYNAATLEEYERENETQTAAARLPIGESIAADVREAAETISHLGYYEQHGRGSAALSDEERAELERARAELDQEHRRALEYALAHAVHVARWRPAGAKVPAAGAVLARASALIELERRLARVDELEQRAGNPGRWAQK